MTGTTLPLGPLTTEAEFESWTDDQKYLYVERLGILCGNREPTADEDRIARAEVILSTL